MLPVLSQFWNPANFRKSSIGQVNNTEMTSSENKILEVMKKRANKKPGVSLRDLPKPNPF